MLSKINYLQLRITSLLILNEILNERIIKIISNKKVN